LGMIRGEESTKKWGSLSDVVTATGLER
jgi:hypothetical protein